MKQKSSTIPDMESIKDDQPCVGQITHGDKKKIFTYIRRFICDFALAEDILQDTLLKVYQSVEEGKYSDDGKFISWVMRIAHNLIIDHFRMVKQINTISTDSYDYDLLNLKRFSEDNIEDDMVKRELRRVIRKMISQLPEAQKEVVILKHYKNLSFKEIAVITNVGINTALGRMRYALLNLRRMMEEKKIILSFT